MAPRSIATGTVSFGLVSIPVKLYAATEASASVGFNLLHGKCGARLKQQYVCSTDGEVVPRDAMVKGYEFQKDKYVTFTAEELKALEQSSTQAIEIAEFVPAEKVDAVFFEKAYYLGPDKGGDKAYRLLAEALRRAGKAAVARYAARGKQYLVLLRAAQGRLVMQQLYHADEIRPLADVPLGDGELKEPEVQLALHLVEQTASAEFHPEHYRDEVRERTLALIEQKVQGREIAVAPAEEPRAQVIDLMEALKASLAAGKPAAAAPPPTVAEPAAEAPGPSEAAEAPPRKPPRRAPREEPAKGRAAKK
jgi:DNA end-binding protein Ku